MRKLPLEVQQRLEYIESNYPSALLDTSYEIRGGMDYQELKMLVDQENLL